MISKAFRWWTRELADMLPARPRHPRPAGGKRLVVDAAGPETITLSVETGRSARQITAEPIPAAALVDVLRDVAAADRQLPVTLRVHPGNCFERTVELPEAAEREFDRMLALDLERATPLRAGDVLSAHRVVGRAEPGLVSVRHVVLKARAVEPHRRALAAAGMQLAAIECKGADGGPPLAFRLADAPPPAASRLAATAAVLALALMPAAAATYWWRHEVALSAIQAEIARLEPAARQAGRALAASRAGEGDAALLRRLDGRRQPAVAVLEEVTRLVPDTAWVQELRFDGASVEIAGTAASAAALLPAFERSALFYEARFTAPLRIEPGESGERFRLRARLRSPALPEPDDKGGGQ